MTFHHFNRRLHLYLAMFLLPWFIIYGISSAPFSHPTWFRGELKWTTRIDRTYDAGVTPEMDAKQAGALILKDNGLNGAFGANWAKPRQLNIYKFSFLDVTRLSYDLDTKRLLAEDRPFAMAPILTGIHARGGFEQESVLNDAWGVLVDVVCVGFLLWLATGIYMWWHLPSTRFWGWVAMGSGLALFVVFMLTL